MKTILVLAGGQDSDKAVFDTAVGVAKLLDAHMEFLHVHLGPGEAALHSPHVAFARGAALTAAMHHLKDEADRRSASALHHFEELCEGQKMEIALCPGDAVREGLCVSWRVEDHGAAEKIIQAARHNDLVVVGRAQRSNGLPPDLIEQLLMSSGRPVLIAPSQAAAQWRSEVTLVFWKETAEAARTVGATLPLLRKSKKVVIASVEEGENASPEGLYHLAQRLEWNGIDAEARWLTRTNESTSARLERLSHEICADLLVMGGYSRGRVREIVFGGCTSHFLEVADRPVLLMH